MVQERTARGRVAALRARGAFKLRGVRHASLKLKSPRLSVNGKARFFLIGKRPLKTLQLLNQ